MVRELGNGTFEHKCLSCEKVVRVPHDESMPVRVSGCDNKSRGLGDTAAKVIGAFGINPCRGCGKRQAALNKLLPYKQ